VRLVADISTDTRMSGGQLRRGTFVIIPTHFRIYGNTYIGNMEVMNNSVPSYTGRWPFVYKYDVRCERATGKLVAAPPPRDPRPPANPSRVPKKYSLAEYPQRSDSTVLRISPVLHSPVSSPTPVQWQRPRSISSPRGQLEWPE
jgi:hypothetical protein